jgi:hypothetical protein
MGVREMTDRKEIELSQNKVAVVDADMFDELSKYKWCYYRGYAVRLAIDKITKKYSMIHMHRVVNTTPDALDTDHINGNKLDNRKSNLRSATKSENMCNRGKPKNNTSGFKGVYWHNQNKKWYARIELHSKGQHLGYFSTPELAAEAYNAAAVSLHGEFANLNK